MSRPDSRSCSDSGEVVRRAVAGDRAALSEVWRQNRAWLASVLLGNLPRGVDLEDLLQDVAVRVVREIRRLEHPAALRGWLRAVTLNTARSAARREAVPARRARRLPELAAEVADPTQKDARRREEVAGLLEHAMRIVADLRPSYREPLLLKSVHGWSQKQIAATLGLPVTAIESRLARARRMLRQGMASAWSETRGAADRGNQVDRAGPAGHRVEQRRAPRSGSAERDGAADPLTAAARGDHGDDA